MPWMAIGVVVAKSFGEPAIQSKNGCQTLTAWASSIPLGGCEFCIFPK
jgi:hypothetical protein